MKTFANASPRDVGQAVMLAQQAHRDGKAASFAGGGSDLLALVKERIVTPDVLISLKSIRGLDHVTTAGGGGTICGPITPAAFCPPTTLQHRDPVYPQTAPAA